jgi:hypothetical protein
MKLLPSPEMQEILVKVRSLNGAIAFSPDAVDFWVSSRQDAIEFLDLADPLALLINDLHYPVANIYYSKFRRPFQIWAEMAKGIQLPGGKR